MTGDLYGTACQSYPESLRNSPTTHIPSCRWLSCFSNGRNLCTVGINQHLTFWTSFKNFPTDFFFNPLDVERAYSSFTYQFATHLEKRMATHSSILAWRIPQRSLVVYSPWDHRVAYDWVTNTFTFTLLRDPCCASLLKEAEFGISSTKQKAKFTFLIIMTLRTLTFAGIQFRLWFFSDL